jgi:hypothetical protein
VTAGEGLGEGVVACDGFLLGGVVHRVVVPVGFLHQLQF